MVGADHDGARTRIVAALGVLLLGGWLTGSAAGSQPAPGELPPVTLSTTTLHDGDTLSMSGTGCLDPESGTGDGLVVVLRRPTDLGRGGVSAVLATVTAEVASDGTFAGSATVEQPLYPTGPQQAYLSCERASSPDEAPNPSLLARAVDIEVVAPSLPDLTVTAGATFDHVLPCTIDGGEYGSFGFLLTAPGRPDIGFSVRGSFPYEDSPQEGDVVQLQVPADAVPGTYAAAASCSVSQAGVSAYWTGFTVTVTAAGTPVAPSATPVGGRAAYTG